MASEPTQKHTIIHYTLAFYYDNCMVQNMTDVQNIISEYIPIVGPEGKCVIKDKLKEINLPPVEHKAAAVQSFL